MFVLVLTSSFMTFRSVRLISSIWSLFGFYFMTSFMNGEKKKKKKKKKLWFFGYENSSSILFSPSFLLLLWEASSASYAYC